MALARARRDFEALAARYAAAVAAELAHSLRWICAWARLAAVYRSLVSRVEPGHPAAAKLPGLNGNRRVRTPLWAGERLGWWRQSPTWAVHDWGGRADDRPSDRPPDAGGEHRACLCSAPPAPAGSCLAEGGAHSCARPLDARGAPIGQPCLGKRVDGRPSCGVRCGAAELLDELLDGYFALLNRQAVLAIRSQRWRCSWLYKLRACWTAEGLATHADPERPPPPSSGAACASVLPPQDEGRLGWGSANPANLTRGELDSLLYRWRCW